jgi:hypothetical protein
VLRDATCPVLTVQRQESDVHLVAKWMTPHPISAEPAEKLAAVRAKMLSGHFRSMPVLNAGKLAGIITDRDLRRHEGYLDHTEVRLAMTTEVDTVTPSRPFTKQRRPCSSIRSVRCQWSRASGWSESSPAATFCAPFSKRIEREARRA